MKKKLLFVFGACTLMSISIMAQPTITATGVNPAIGDNFIYNLTTYVSPGSAGANQNWDLSAMTINNTFTINAVNPSSTTNGSSYPNANIAEDYGSAGNISYYKTSSSAWQNYGSYTSNIKFIYSNPEDLLRFPFTYNDNYNDPWACTFTNTYNFYRTGSSSVTADGYGTLKTPAGTFSNALRVHFVQTYQDSANVGVPYIITYQNDEYLWYLNGNHFPIAAVAVLTTNSSNQSSYGYYLPTVLNGIEDVNSIISSCSVFPNPAKNNIHVSATLTETKNVEVKLCDLLGQEVTSSLKAEGIQGENNFSFDTSTLSEGIYFAQVLLNGKLATTQKFVVAK